MKNWKTLCLAGALALLPLTGWSATTYAMKITPSMPKGSAGEKPAATQPVSTKFSPCNTTQVDAVSFALAYNAGATAADLMDVYMFFFNPNGDGETTPKYYVLSRTSIANGGAALVARNTLADIKTTDLYLAKDANPGAAVTESLLGSFIAIDGIQAGTWQLVGIVADRATVNFDQPSTWLAWDVATVVLGKPWTGSANTTCQ